MNRIWKNPLSEFHVVSNNPFYYETQTFMLLLENHYEPPCASLAQHFTKKWNYKSQADLRTLFIVEVEPLFNTHLAFHLKYKSN